MQRHTGHFTAHDDAGKAHTIHIYTDFIDASTMDGSAEIEGMKAFRTGDDLHVNRLEKGHYEIVGTRMRLRSSAPDAP